MCCNTLETAGGGIGMKKSLGLTVVWSEQRVHIVLFILPQVRPDGVSLFSNASGKKIMDIVFFNNNKHSAFNTIDMNGMDGQYTR